MLNNSNVAHILHATLSDLFQSWELPLMFSADKSLSKLIYSQILFIGIPENGLNQKLRYDNSEKKIALISSNQSKNMPYKVSSNYFNFQRSFMIIY